MRILSLLGFFQCKKYDVIHLPIYKNLSRHSSIWTGPESIQYTIIWSSPFKINQIHLLVPIHYNFDFVHTLLLLGFLNKMVQIIHLTAIVVMSAPVVTMVACKASSVGAVMKRIVAMVEAILLSLLSSHLEPTFSSLKVIHT